MRIHGGDKGARLDFSSNTNPLGPPPILYEALTRCIDGGAILSYPDYNYENLRRAIAKFYRCEQENVIPTNGAAEALNLVIIALRPRALAVLEPSYGEYEDLSRVLEIRYIDIYYSMRGTTFYINLEDLKKICKEVDVIIITNPNNPTGSYTPVEEVIRELSDCKSIVVIDEAYIELCTSCPIDVVSWAPENFVFVRSLTKWLATPGLRLGFIYTPNKDLVNKIDIVRQPWNVNGIAECVAVQTLQHEAQLKTFIENTRRYVKSESLRVSEALKNLGLQVFDSVTNFLLVDLRLDAKSIIASLRSRGITIRSCESFKGLGPNYVRLSIRRREENDELIKTLGEELSVAKALR